jgi:hypothetical protein
LNHYDVKDLVSGFSHVLIFFDHPSFPPNEPGAVPGHFLRGRIWPLILSGIGKCTIRKNTTNIIQHLDISIYIIYIIYHNISGTILAETNIKMMNNEEEQFAKCLLEPSLKQDDNGEQTGNGNGMTFSSICQIDVRRCTKDAPDSQELPEGLPVGGDRHRELSGAFELLRP